MKNKRLLTVFLGLLLSNLSFSQQGCMDATAINYNPEASAENFSCTYAPITLEFPPSQHFQLPHYLSETSGLTLYNGLHWTHNDDSSSKIYGLDPSLGTIVDSLDLGIQVQDWEDLKFHNGKFYVGDFGNNVNGARTNLRIFRYDVSTHEVDTIRFQYVNQTNLNPVSANTTNFDCEAFLVNDDHIYLFTKQWTTNRTELHTLVNQTGNQVTTLMGDFNCEGLITGATFGTSEVILVGYTQLLAPFMIRLMDYQGDNFLVSNKRKYTLNLGFHQVEAVVFDEEREMIAVSNETFSVFGQTIAAKWMYFDWNDLILMSTVSDGGMHIESMEMQHKIPVYISNQTLFAYNESLQIQIVNLMGQELFNGRIPSEGLKVHDWSQGQYFVHAPEQSFKYRIQIRHE